MTLTSNSTPPINSSSNTMRPASPPPKGLPPRPTEATPKVQPRVSPTQAALVYYFIGLLALVVLFSFAFANQQAEQVIFEPANLISFLSITVAASICSWFPFKVPPNLYFTLSMLLYFTALFSFPAVSAAIVAIIASLVFELFVVKRGSAYAARTAGMYVFCLVAGRSVYEGLGGRSLSGDFSFELALPVLGSFLVFRLFNELVIGLTQYLQGYSIWAVREHIVSVTAIYLMFLPGALVVAMLKFSAGPVAFTVGCVLVAITSLILNRATSAREKESDQLTLVRELNERLARQNDQQLKLGNRINYTLDSFLSLVRDYAETSHEQEAAVVEITSTIEQLSRTASQIAGAADNVASAAERAMDAAQSGQQAVDTTIEAMNDVRNKVREIATKISDLNAKSERIGEIVTVINGIAGEIRLLALNATIEASGAGQFGRRFSIVANEVNLLADRSREALLQIKQIIAEIQAATISSRRATEEGLQRMERSVIMASSSEKANKEIISVVQKTAQAAAAISLATQQQRSASEQVVTSVHDVAVMIGQNAEKVASVSVASLDLQRVARELRAED